MNKQENRVFIRSCGMMETNPVFPYSIAKIKGKVQHYVWGGVSYLPGLLGMENNEQKPFAEYWLGTHPLGESELILGDRKLALGSIISASPEMALTPTLYQQFGELPFLLKVLDVKDMLSIQVHPTKAVAEAGFEREEALGIPLNAPNRNYKDKNHKPEIMLAISEFWLLHGFKSEAAIARVLDEVQEFQILSPFFRNDGLKALYQFVMEMDQKDINAMLLPLVKRTLRQKRDGEIQRNDPGWWVAKLFEGKESIGDIDRGVFSIYFLNIVHLQPGEGIFQGAGVPHAYLEGQNVELMSNSDNVLRGGLTPKYIDVPELMRNTVFEPVIPAILKGRAVLAGEIVYDCPVPDFSIARLDLNAAIPYHNEAKGPEIWIVTEGGIVINNHLVMKKGEAAIVFPGYDYVIQSSGEAILYRAFVPLDKAYTQDEEN